MEKRISFFEFQTARNVAKAIDPFIRKREGVKGKIEKLLEEYKAINAQIDALDAGIYQVLGFHAADIVKKVTDENTKIAKYLPADNVSYDKEKNQYVITAPSTEETNAQVDAVHPQETVVPPTTADGPGSDYDIDKDNWEAEQSDAESQESEDAPF